MKISFYPRITKTGKTALIILSVHSKNWRVAISTGVSLDPNKWEQSKQRAKRGYIYETTVNARLKTIALIAAEEFHRILNDGIAPTKEQYKERLLARLRPTQTTEIELPTIWQGFDVHKKERATTLAPRTLLVYDSVKNHLEAFDTAYKLKLTWETLTLPFFTKWVDYLLNVQGLNNATLDKVIERFRAFLRWCEEQKGLPVNPDYKRFTGRNLPKGDSSQKLYLSNDELNTLRQLDLSDNSRLARVRDLFLFLCYTGLRYGDSQTLRPEHRKGNDLYIVTGKNRKAIQVPLHPIAQEIWNRWEGTIPKISNQKFNTYLREVCQIAEFNASEIVVTYKGSQRVESTVPRWQLIAAHTAKRTAVTNLLLLGLSVEMVCLITGNTAKTIHHYVVMTSEDAKQAYFKAIEKTM